MKFKRLYCITNQKNKCKGDAKTAKAFDRFCLKMGYYFRPHKARKERQMRAEGNLHYLTVAFTFVQPYSIQ